MTNKGDTPRWSEATQTELDRFGFADPYDPRFIHAAVFGTRMSGRSQRWPDIDFDALAEVNPDVVGWVRMKGCPIDYPVVADHLDASYYLQHNFSGEESLHGQVVFAFGCGRRKEGPNTVLAAHTMSDWSMFRAIRALSRPQSPRWVLGPSFRVLWRATKAWRTKVRPPPEWMACPMTLMP